MNTDTILDLLDNSSRIRAFNSCLEKLEDAPQLDLEALRVCIKLRPAQPTAAGAGYQGKDTPSHVESAVPPDQDIIALNERLHGLLVARIPQETLDSDHFYNLARILCSNGPFADAFFRGNIYQGLLALLPELSRHTDVTDELEGSVTRDVRRAKSYLTLLKCSYWLPSNCYHVVDSSSLGLLSQFMGIEVTDDIAQDAISALLSLLRRGEPIVVAAPSVARQSWLNLDAISGQAVLSTSIIDDCLWERLSALEHKNQTGGESMCPISSVCRDSHHSGMRKHFSMLLNFYCCHAGTDNGTGKRSSKIFRTWFQWMFQAANDKVQLRCLHDSSYWEIIRQGLLSGYADQRKYCIGIIRHSLLAAQSDICTPVMDFRVAERAVYLKAYEQYSALFETIVLDRYANQVQACLPELTKLLQTVVTPPMVSTLLSAALSPMVQDGVRKLVGNWYIEHVITVSLVCYPVRALILPTAVSSCRSDLIITSKVVHLNHARPNYEIKTVADDAIVSRKHQRTLTIPVTRLSSVGNHR
jgi:tRNA guanosine-2'-O-methyltransferase